MSLLLASTRSQVTGYISTVIYVYTLLIVVYIIVQLVFSLGFRPSYSRTLDSVVGFLRDICEPYLRIFRRVIPQIGGIDFSPIVAIFVLEAINSLVVHDLIG